MNNLKNYIQEKLYIGKDYIMKTDMVDLICNLIDDNVATKATGLFKSWLKNNKYNPNDCILNVYSNEDLNKVDYLDKKIIDAIKVDKNRAKNVPNKWNFARSFGNRTIYHKPRIFCICLPYVENGRVYFASIYVEILHDVE